MTIGNPYLPLDEFVPDAEPHVFGERVYIYGSHDEVNGTRFCTRDYVVYSADIRNLSEWTCHGVAYKKSQDPRSREGALIDMYAPDCVRGNDGRYYLYYFAAGPNTPAFGPMSVAVSDAPEGPFQYLDDIKDKQGKPIRAFLTNDPAVINDNGRIWLYYGWGLGRDFRNKWLQPVYRLVLSKLGNRSWKEVKHANPSILSCAVAELEEDMVTVKAEPKAVLDSKTTALRNSLLYRHAFYEAASIRKFGDWYYLVYSSGEHGELAYAMSRFPDHDFTYRGVIVSNCDMGYDGNTQPKAAYGTIHGGIECINGTYYVFYHRCTNNTDFSRQACAEPIQIREDGTIAQVEMTTQGLYGRPLPAKGVWPAVCCCNLYDARTDRVTGPEHSKEVPMIAYRDGCHVITNVTNGTWIGYKYFAFQGIGELEIRIRGGSGELQIYQNQNAPARAKIRLRAADMWTAYRVKVPFEDGTLPLFFQYCGNETIEILDFSLL